MKRKPRENGNGELEVNVQAAEKSGTSRHFLRSGRAQASEKPRGARGLRAPQASASAKTQCPCGVPYTESRSSQRQTAPLGCFVVCRLLFARLTRSSTCRASLHGFYSVCFVYAIWDLKYDSSRRDF